MMQKVKDIIRYASAGRGIASSLVSAFQVGASSNEQQSARLILLGVPPSQALRKLLSQFRNESGEVIRFLLAQSKFDLAQSGVRADRLAPLLEKWGEQRQKYLMEQRVLQTRILLVSIILGAVMAFFSSLLPFISSFNLGRLTPVTPNSLVLLSFALAMTSSFYLSMSAASRIKALGPILTAVVFVSVYYFSLPLSSVGLSIP
jgi:hypothetical protein